MVFKDGMWAKINDEWLSVIWTLVEFGGVENRVPKSKFVVMQLPWQ